MFWILYWLKEDKLEDGEGEEEAACKATAEGMEGAWVLVGELMGMYTCEV